MQNSTEQLQYEKLISFFKSILNWMGIIFTFLLSIISVFFYSDRQSMDKEKRELIAERTSLQVAYNQKIVELSKDIDGFKIRSLETISSTRNEAQEKILLFQKSSNNEIKNLGELARSEISEIKISASKVANQETEKQVANVFQQDKVKKLLEDKVIKESEGLISEVFQQKSSNLVKINSWMVQFSQGSYYGNREHLENFEGWLNKEFPNVYDQQTVRNLNQTIVRDYETECYVRAKNFFDSNKISDFDKDVIDSSANKDKIEILSSKLYRPDNLHEICTRKHIIGILRGKDFEYRCFNPNR